MQARATAGRHSGPGAGTVTAAGGDPSRNSLPGAGQSVNFRRALRGMFRAALERLAADGVVGITAEELPGLMEQVRETADPKFGDYSGTMAMALAKRAGLKPRDMAVAIMQRLDVGDLFEPPTEPVGPGFINLRVRGDALARALVAAACDPRMGVPVVDQPARIVIDYSSPNVAKPMHVGHIRSTVIGDALAKILRFRGHHTITDNHLGDWGTQFGMILWGWKHLRDDAAYAADPTAELGRLYKFVRKLVDAKPEELAADPAAAALAGRYPDVAQAVLAETAKLHEGDPENRALWEQFMPSCRAEIDRIYRRLHVRFDHTLGESFYQPLLGGVVEELVASGLARESPWGDWECFWEARTSRRCSSARPTVHFSTRPPIWPRSSGAWSTGSRTGFSTSWTTARASISTSSLRRRSSGAAATGPPWSGCNWCMSPLARCSAPMGNRSKPGPAIPLGWRRCSTRGWSGPGRSWTAVTRAAVVGA